LECKSTPRWSATQSHQSRPRAFSNTCFSETSDYLPFQRWVYNRGSTKICVAPNQYSDTEFCIDFGTNLGSNGQTLYIWQAYEGLPQQQLYITDDNHIAVEGGNQCADVKAESGPQPDYARPYGSLKDVQSYQCFFGNTNQVSSNSSSNAMETEAEGFLSDLWVLHLSAS
jgi:hypothetical protein